jgi:Ca2+-binding RTX toxin-like protein
VEGSFHFIITGDSNNNYILTDVGDDLLDGGSGDDVLKGGLGSDTYRYAYNGTDIIEDAGGDSDELILTVRDDVDTAYWGKSYFSNGDLVFESRHSSEDKLTITDALGQGRIEFVTYHAGSGSFEDHTMRISSIDDGFVGSDIAYFGTLDDDVISMNDGYNEAYGSDGNDTITLGDGGSWVSGGAGNDMLVGGAGGDQLNGDYGSADAGDDTLYGYAGNDTLRGDAGDDLLDGGDGNDTLYGGAGNDELRGGEGNDTFYTGTGRNLVVTGSGDDSVYMESSGDVFLEQGNDTLDMGGVWNWVHLGSGATQGVKVNFTDTAQVVGGTTLASLTTVDGYGGTDTFVNAEAGSHFWGTEFNDFMVVDRGTWWSTTEGHDSFIDISGEGRSWVAADNVDVAVNWDLNTGLLQYQLSGSAVGVNELTISGVNNLSGSIYNDVLIGNGESNTLWGGSGDDTVSGGAGDDTYSYKHQAGFDTYTDISGRDSINFWIGDAGAVDSFGDFKRDGDNFVYTAKNGLSGFTIVDHFNGQAIENINYIFSDSSLVANYSIAIRSDTPIDDASETLVGTTGNDTLSGGIGYEEIYAGDGDDVIKPGVGGGMVFAGAGNDTIEATGNLWIDGAEGIDTLQFDTGVTAGATVVLADEEGAGLTGKQFTVGASTEAARSISNVENVVGTAFDDYIYGDDYGNEISGAGGDDSLHGGGGDDTITGGAGNDDIRGNEGADHIYGGAGIDHYASYLNRWQGDVIYDFEIGERLLIQSSDATGPDARNISYSEVGTNTGEYLFTINNGGNAPVTFTVHSATPISYFSVSSDVGNPSNTYIDINQATDNADTIYGSDGDDEIFAKGGEDIVYPGSGDDIIHLHSNPDTTWSGGRVFLTEGSDTLDLGGAWAWVHFVTDHSMQSAQGTQGVQINFTNSSQTVDGKSLLAYTASDAYGDNDSFVNVGPGAHLRGSVANDTLISDKHFWWTVSPGQDSISNSTDMGSFVSAIDAADSVNWDLNTTQLNYTLAGDTAVHTVQINNIASISGSAYNDTLTGNADNNALRGKEGDDTLIGGDGNDVLDGGAGSDLLQGGLGSDTYQYAYNGTDVLQDEGGGAEELILSIKDAENIGYWGNNYFADGDLVFESRQSSGDKLTIKDALGEGRIESLTYRFDNDTHADSTFRISSPDEVLVGSHIAYFGTLGDDVITMNDGYNEAYASDGNDTITTGNSGGWVSGDTGNDTLIGGAGNDQLYGGYGSQDAGDDTLYGYAGNDILNGGNGNDTLDGGIGNDYILAGSGVDMVQLESNEVWGSGYAAKNVDTSVSFGTGEVIDISGLIKHSDVIDGGGDNDTLNLQAGSDVFFLDDVFTSFNASALLDGATSTARVIDIESILGHAGNDIIDLTSNKFTLANNTSIYGGDGDDIIWAADGADLLYGDAGNDSLSGGAGNDTLTGGSGADRFQFTATSGNDVITDFNLVDGDTLNFYHRSGQQSDINDLSIHSGTISWDTGDGDRMVNVELSNSIALNSLDDLNSVIVFHEIV